jgi:hypothetical protein
MRCLVHCQVATPTRGFDTQFVARFEVASKNFEDAINGPVREPVANTDGNDAVHPVVFTGAVSNTGIHSKIVARGTDVLALASLSITSGVPARKHWQVTNLT